MDIGWIARLFDDYTAFVWFLDFRESTMHYIVVCYHNDMVIVEQTHVVGIDRRVLESYRSLFNLLMVVIVHLVEYSVCLLVVSLESVLWFVDSILLLLSLLDEVHLVDECMLPVLADWVLMGLYLDQLAEWRLNDICFQVIIVDLYLSCLIIRAAVRYKETLLD